MPGKIYGDGFMTQPLQLFDRALPAPRGVKTAVDEDESHRLDLRSDRRFGVRHSQIPAQTSVWAVVTRQISRWSVAGTAVRPRASGVRSPASLRPAGCAGSPDRRD